MFLRFVTAELHGESHQELGIFQAAYRLRDKGSLSQLEESLLKEIADWFNWNLHKPKRFTSAKPPYYRKRQNGISWFKDSAQEHIGKMREMVALLEHHDVSVRMIKTTRPGYVVYEDEFQIVAVPFADSDI
jgi:hypothetical protein